MPVVLTPKRNGLCTIPFYPMPGHWLLDLSELSDLLGARPVRSHLVHALVQVDQDHTAAGTDEPWPAFYARRLYEQFGRA